MTVCMRGSVVFGMKPDLTVVLKTTSQIISLSEPLNDDVIKQLSEKCSLKVDLIESNNLSIFKYRVNFNESTQLFETVFFANNYGSYVYCVSPVLKLVSSVSEISQGACNLLRSVYKRLILDSRFEATLPNAVHEIGSSIDNIEKIFNFCKTKEQKSSNHYNKNSLSEGIVLCTLLTILAIQASGIVSNTAKYAHETSFLTFLLGMLAAWFCKNNQAC